jgi:uncharacterized membrane protein
MFQVVISIVQDLFRIIPTFAFIMLSAIVFSISILYTELTAYLPIYSSLHLCVSSKSLVQRLKYHYAVKAFMFYCVGGIAILYYKWGINFIMAILKPLLAFTKSPGTDLSIVADEIVTNCLNGIINNYFMFIWLIALGLSLLIYNRYSNQKGARSEVSILYHRHEVRYLLVRQESRLELLAFGAALGFSTYFSILFPLLSIILNKKSDSFDNWINGMNNTKTGTTTEFKETILNVYSTIVVTMIIIMSFYDLSTKPNLLFSLLILSPILIAVLTTLVQSKKVTNNLYIASAIIKIYFSVTFFVAGIIQYFDVRYAPFVGKINNLWLDYREYDVVPAILLFTKTLIFCWFIYAAIEIWLNSQLTSKMQPIEEFFRTVRKAFIFSIALRLALLVLYFQLSSFNSGFETAALLIMLIATLHIGKDYDKHFIEISASNSENSIRNVKDDENQTLINKLSNFIERRNRFNLSFFWILIIVSLGNHTFLHLVVGGFIGTIVFSLYVVKMYREYIDIYKLFHLKLPLKTVNLRIANLIINWIDR